MILNVLLDFIGFQNFYQGLALLLLEANGIIKLKGGAGLTATVNDIEENFKNVKIQELEAAQVSRVKDELLRHNDPQCTA